VFAIAVATAFVIQWVVFVPSYLARTERFFDLTGSVTYIAVTLGLLLLAGSWDARRVLLAVLVLVWAVRLGIFLFGRVSRSGADDRFDEIKGSFPRFLAVWTIQGLWVSVTAAAAWIAISASRQVGIDAFAVVGFLLWAAGFAVEVVADHQKSRFRADPAHRGRFISTGLWSRSRHPNYFGENLLWIGVAVIALPVLDGWHWVGLVSPVFVAMLITRVSGVPLLEAKAEAKWGGQPDYEEYKQTTPVLVPRLR
jgi:steroid 5-alpha reductase family enzyme